jgi:hypothetical protein
VLPLGHSHPNSPRDERCLPPYHSQGLRCGLSLHLVAAHAAGIHTLAEAGLNIPEARILLRDLAEVAYTTLEAAATTHRDEDFDENVLQNRSLGRSRDASNCVT